jgi:hypothetical protein
MPTKSQITVFESLSRLLNRFRYPVSMPDDVARDLGFRLPNTLSFTDFLKALSSTTYRPTRLWKMMPRYRAEMMFKSALKKEVFPTSTLFSYSFKKSWLVFALYFDDQSRLRRLFVQCPSCVAQKSFDIPLDEELILAEASSH